MDQHQRVGFSTKVSLTYKLGTYNEESKLEITQVSSFYPKTTHRCFLL